MKFSLSTNGWESYGWHELFDAIRDAEFEGVELHGISDSALSAWECPFQAKI